MKERPILFSAPMVRAILEGRKTQTRRVVKRQPTWRWPGNATRGAVLHEQENGLIATVGFGQACEQWGFGFSPYGVPGDRLWVKETIERGPTDVAERVKWDSAVYAADGAPTPLDTWPWQRNVLSSIHCPRGLSRITLEVTGVRVERLNDISEEDAKAEGAEALEDHGGDRLHSYGFCALWESINGADSWAANPWVWVIEFKRVEAKSEAA